MIVDKVYYRWTLRILHNRVGIGEEQKVEQVFRKTEFWREFLGWKLEIFNWWIDPKTISLFIAEIYSQLGSYQDKFEY